MRLNKFLSSYTGLSRRAADKLVIQGKVTINGQLAKTGAQVLPEDFVTLDDKEVRPVSNKAPLTILFNKPEGIVCSLKGQGSKTVYDYLDKPHKTLKIAGRLDKDSCGLVILTSDGELAQALTHPKNGKLKTYIVTLDRVFKENDGYFISNKGVRVKDQRGSYNSSFDVQIVNSTTLKLALVTGRNRQIRKTLNALGYGVVRLKRLSIGSYSLGNLAEGEWRLATRSNPPK